MKRNLISALIALICTTGVMGVFINVKGVQIKTDIATSNGQLLSEELYNEENLPEEISIGEEAEKIVEETKVVSLEENKKTIKEISNTVYTSKSELGFIVTTDNKTYDLDEKDIELLIAIVSAESDKSYDDALAVISVILNRCEAKNWVRSYGANPVKQATAKNQFVVYQKGYYKRYLGDKAPKTVQIAVNDALNGVRNNKYLSFRANSVKNYSNNKITKSGNRYK